MGRWEPGARGRLAQAAYELFFERGYEATTVADIAARAGLTERTFFRHFSDKREVLFDGSSRLSDAFRDGLAAAPPHASPLAAVQAAVEASSALLADGNQDAARRRNALVTAHAELRERELIKMDALTGVLTAGLAARGVPEPAASLAAQLGVGAFRVAFEQWVGDPRERAFVDVVRETFDALAGVAAAREKDAPMIERTGANADEIAYWNDDAGDPWVRFQERMDRAFEPLSAAGIATARARPGEQVVDVGCGCGASLLDLAPAVEPGGSVLGIDVSAPMLARARERIAVADLTNVRVELADAATRVFDASADLVYSRFGVMFFVDREAAFANLRGALRPGGRLVFICWRELADNPWFSIPVDAVRPHVPPQPRPDPSAPGPMQLADAVTTRELLLHAGFADVQLERVDAALPFGTVAQAAETLSHVGPTARFVAGGDAAQRARALEALATALASHVREGEVRLDAGVWVVSASVR